MNPRLFMRLSKFGFTMFQVAARLITLLSVLMHAALGCCAHHDHCAADHRDVSAAVANPEKSVPAKSGPAKSVPVKTRCGCRFHQKQSFAEHVTGANVTFANEGSTEKSCPCGESHGECEDHCAWMLSDRTECPIESTRVDLPATLSLLCESGLPNNAALLQLQSNFALSPHDAGALRALAQIWRL